MGRKPIITIAGVAVAIALAGCQQTPQKTAGNFAPQTNANGSQVPQTKQVSSFDTRPGAGAPSYSQPSGQPNPMDNYKIVQGTDPYKQTTLPGTVGANSMNQPVGQNPSYTTANPSAFAPGGAMPKPAPGAMVPGNSFADPSPAFGNLNQPQIQPPINTFQQQSAPPALPTPNYGSLGGGSPGAALPLTPPMPPGSKTYQ